MEKIFIFVAEKSLKKQQCAENGIIFAKD